MELVFFEGYRCVGLLRELMNSILELSLRGEGGDV